jgi:hypothetical protein
MLPGSDRTRAQGKLTRETKVIAPAEEVGRSIVYRIACLRKVRNRTTLSPSSLVSINRRVGVPADRDPLRMSR